jgi:hypothetical protein
VALDGRGGHPDPGRGEAIVVALARRGLRDYITYIILQVLDLSDNNIGMEGAKALTVVLATNRGLKYINLSNNCICGVQVQYITSTTVQH